MIYNMSIILLLGWYGVGILGGLLVIYISDYGNDARPFTYWEWRDTIMLMVIALAGPTTFMVAGMFVVFRLLDHLIEYL